MTPRVQKATLGLWMNGVFVGRWTVSSSGLDLLRYDPTWVESAEGRPLSLSLPFAPPEHEHIGNNVRSYFDNLLPDSLAIRERIARRFRIGSVDAFDLLREIGRDCVGALQILPEGVVPSALATMTPTPLDDHEIAQILRDATGSNILGQSFEDDSFRISLAGAQEKTALLRRDGNWYAPTCALPTTHIFKLPLGLVGGQSLDMRDSVENEYLCALILKEYGLAVAQCEPMQFKGMKALVVERFDRTLWTDRSAKDHLIRLPQEDFCQATGTASARKYEADGGPGMDRILSILDGSSAPEEAKRSFFTAQLLFWMLYATDGHAKNFSIFLRPGARAYESTPLYDVISFYPALNDPRQRNAAHKLKMAMAVRAKNPHWKLKEILRRHWIEVGTRHRILTVDGRDCDALISDIVERTEGVISAVTAQLPKDFPEHVAESIFSGLSTAAHRLAGPPQIMVL